MWINCEQLESSLRLSWISQQLTNTSLWTLLWVKSLSEIGIATSWSDVTTHITTSTSKQETWILWIIGLVKSQIYDLAIEQNEIVKNNICELVNNQLISIQDRPLRQVAWIILLYIIIRPLISLLIILNIPIWVLLRKILIVSKVLKKEKKRVCATRVVFK
jgi:hypothetical protein